MIRPTSADLARWRGLCGAWRLSLDHPTQPALKQLRNWAGQARLARFPDPADPVGQRLFKRLVDEGLTWWALPPEERSRLQTEIRTILSACDEALASLRDQGEPA